MRMFSEGRSLKDKLFFFITGYLTSLGFMLWGKGGGGGGGTQTSYSTNLPAYAKPYYEQLMKSTAQQVYETSPLVYDKKGKVIGGGQVTGVKARPEYLDPETGKPMPRIAGFEPGQIAVQQETAGLGTPDQFGQATSGLNLGQGMGYGAAAQGLNQAFGYNPTAITEQSVNSQSFGGQNASQYMSPYQQYVTDIALREAQLQGAKDRRANMFGAINRGTFGGAGYALGRAEQQRYLNQNLSDIQARGSQSAYESAMQQFNQDQARRQQALLANQQANLEAQKVTQQGQQFQAGLGKDIGLAGLTAGLQGSQALGQLGSAEQAANLDRLRAQAASAAEPQAMKQREMDLGYQQFMEKQNYGKQQLEYLSNILRGNAGALGSTQTQYNPPPSLVSQIGGLGLAGLGLSKALG
jgi:hypothetical protein